MSVLMKPQFVTIRTQAVEQYFHVILSVGMLGTLVVQGCCNVGFNSIKLKSYHGKLYV